MPAPVVLAILPSQGLGGGIEAYASAVLEAARHCGVQVTVHTLTHGQGGKINKLSTQMHFTLQVLREARLLKSRRQDVQLLCFHPGLLPVGVLVAWILRHESDRPRVFMYGAEIWSASAGRRALWKWAHVEFVTISPFSAGALLDVSPCSVLLPGIAAQRFERLVAVKRPTVSSPSGPMRVISVFRLADFDAKGGWALVNALQSLRMAGHDVTLTIAGQTGSDIGYTLERLARYDWLKIMQSPSDDEIATLYQNSDLFVLATRLGVSPPSGEGFGIVLVEAALAGLPVIAPAAGGGHSAFLDGLTGLSPRTQSFEDLEELLLWATSHPELLARMGRNGRAWASQAFNPRRYRASIAQLLLGQRSASAKVLDLTLTESVG